MPFPKMLAEAQRASLASDIREAYDRVEAIANGLNELQSPHHAALSAGDLAELKARVRHAREDLFGARVLVERRAGS